MKKALLFISVLLCCYAVKAQFLTNDSLQGFNLAKIVTEAHDKHLQDVELKMYVNNSKKAYIKEKYHFAQNQVPATHLSKYSSNNTSNLPCYLEDFDGYSAGTLTLAGGWIADQNVGSAGSYMCNAGTFSTYPNTSAVVVYATPILFDAYCGPISTSPFGGNVGKINNSGLDVGRIRQTFSVTPNNWCFNYAYRGVLGQQLHGCCNDPNLIFNFYDGAGAPISSMCHTVIMTSSCMPTSTTNWAVSSVSVGTSAVWYMPGWESHVQSLSAYIGTLVTVEVIAAGCTYSTHPGYMYYDARCLNDGYIIANQTAYLSQAASYTSCIPTATLSGLPGFTGYQWQGPLASGVTGVTNSVITTNVSGNYTLTSTVGSMSYSHVITLTVSPNTTTISGNAIICAGNTTTLQVTGTGLTTYSWSNGSTLQSVYITPTATATYSIIVSNTLGCKLTASQSITVVPLPVPSILSNTSSICIGQGANLFATGSGVTSYTWNTGSFSSSISVSPTTTAVYTVNASNSFGCVGSISKTLVVFPLPQAQVALSSPSVCIGNSATLTATGIPGNSYVWSTGPPASSFIVVSPSVTSFYGVIATTSSGCTGSISKTITVYPLPQIQIVGSSPEICIGQTANFGVTGSNISSMQWNTGANSAVITVSPALTSVYSVTVTSAIGCSSSQSLSIIVNPMPQIQIITSSSELCAGQNATLSVSGSTIVSYQWSSGPAAQSIIVSPLVTSNYSVIVIDNKGCASNQSLTLIVNPLPQVQIATSSQSICAGENATLSVNALNIASYQWTGSQTSSSINVSPNVTSQYSVIVTDNKGCMAYATLQLEVILCTRIKENERAQNGLLIFPNPSNGTFEIKGHKTTKAWLVNDLGQILLEFDLSPDNNYTYKIRDLAKGIYFVTNGNASGKIIVK